METDVQRMNEIKQIFADLNMPSTLTAVIDGEWSKPTGLNTQTVQDPATTASVISYERTNEETLNAAVASAERAQRQWAATPIVERGRILHACGVAFLEHSELLAQVESIDTGKPISQARADIAVSARYLEFYAGAVDKFNGETIPQDQGTFAYTRREPYGVIAHITPWNAPVSQMMRGVAPSLAAGNSVVVKPAEVTPMSSLLAAIIMTQAGLPAGLCNIVLGQGSVVGDALSKHPTVQHLTFTGSVQVGRTIGRVAADRIIGCNLELGGKSPMIVCEDADLDLAAEAGALAVIRNSGQSCFAATRLIVHESVEQEFTKKVAQRLRGLSLGHGLEDPDLGPLISGEQRKRVLELVAQAEAEGATLVTGGEVDQEKSGYFVQPTLLSRVTNDMVIANEEVFGPVQIVITFSDLDEAIRIANDTEYGLSAGIFTKDVGRAHRVAAQLEAGQVQVNRYRGAGVEVPFGGYKTSGLGREKGMEALHHYSQLKSVIVNLD